MSDGQAGGQGDDVGSISTLYLGNILYALERCALSLDDEGKQMDAAFYRGIGRKLAEAYGRAKRESEHGTAGD
jgi:hypothetical protein